jgi:hypothetical protein
MNLTSGGLEVVMEWMRFLMVVGGFLGVLVAAYWPILSVLREPEKKNYPRAEKFSPRDLRCHITPR